jgi:hypothetical protein
MGNGTFRHYHYTIFSFHDRYLLFLYTQIQSGLIIIIRQLDRITSLSPSSSTKGELGLSGPRSTFTRFGSTRRGCSFCRGFLGGCPGLFDRDDLFRIITIVV